MPKHPLTGQHLAVLEGLASGETAAETAARMFLTIYTVKTHRRIAYKRLGAKTGAHAVWLAVEAGLLRPRKGARP